MLKLNTDKPQIMLLAFKHNLSSLIDISVKIGDTLVTPTSDVKSLGVTFDPAMTLETHINLVSRVDMPIFVILAILDAS